MTVLRGPIPRLRLAMLLTLAAAGPVLAQAPDNRIEQYLRASGLCHPGQPCAMTEETVKALQASAPSTEQWTPVPAKVQPGAAGAPPSDALVLFDGRSLKEWVGTDDKAPARWRIENGVLTVAKGTGNIETRRRFGNYQLHLEWRIPANITGSGQERGNSGLFLASTGGGDAGYEIQILDSWNNATYVNGQAASIYKQAAPLVNAARPPGEWQSYDVVWTAPTFGASGELKTPAYVTLLHNGVLVQNHTVLGGETVFMGKPFYARYDRAPIKLQAHGDHSAPISFRNIWVRELAP